MIKEFNNYDFELLKIEKGEKEKYRFLFNSLDGGSYFVEISDKYYDLFRVGSNYTGLVKIDNFDEVKNKKGNVWVNLSLESIFEEDRVIWKK